MVPTGGDSAPRGHAAASADILGCQGWRGEGSCHSVGTLVTTQPTQRRRGIRPRCWRSGGRRPCRGAAGSGRVLSQCGLSSALLRVSAFDIQQRHLAWTSDQWVAHPVLPRGLSALPSSVTLTSAPSLLPAPWLSLVRQQTREGVAFGRSFSFGLHLCSFPSRLRPPHPPRPTPAHPPTPWPLRTLLPQRSCLFQVSRWRSGQQ